MLRCYPNLILLHLMLKKFFTVFLGSMAAIWLSFLIFIAIIFVAVLSWTNQSAADSVKSNSVLYLDFTGEAADRYTPPTIRDVILGEDNNMLYFDEICRAVKLAKTDTNIKGIYMNMHGASMGLPMREELRQLLAEFKKSGKWIVAYADNYDQGDYYTASIADEIYINPSGSLAANGMAATVPFFKNALDKLGVEIQVIKVGTFKSAVEPFVLTQMSDSARMMYDVMLNTVWNGYVTDVVSDLGLSQNADSTFKAMSATPMIAYTADELIEARLFKEKLYAYQVENKLRKKLSTDDLNLVTPHEYVAAFDNPLDKIDTEKAHIAVLYAVGDIVDSGKEGTVGETMAPLIAKLADDEKVKGLVLRINSGGGSAFASEQIWASLEYFKEKGKPFVVSMGDVAASGGYYIACGADKIYADPATLTGSIGIFGIIPYAKELLNDKLGINFDVVETNPNTVIGRLDAPLTPAQHAALEKSIHNGYDLFIKRVAEGRGMEEAAVRRIAEGRVWAGVTAKEIGLVDEMGGLNDAVNYVASKCGVSVKDCMDYPTITLTPLEILLSMNMKGIDAADMLVKSSLKALGAADKDILTGMETLGRIRSMSTIQAKMEDIRLY